VRAIGESIKTVFLSDKMPDKNGKIAMEKRQRLMIPGAESILILLKVPEMDVLTLQMEQVRSKNDLS
jgi:hypothetical protein